MRQTYCYYLSRVGAWHGAGQATAGIRWCFFAIRDQSVSLWRWALEPGIAAFTMGPGRDLGSGAFAGTLLSLTGMVP